VPDALRLFGFYAVSIVGGMLSSAFAVAAAGTAAVHNEIPAQIAANGAVLASLTSTLIDIPLVAGIASQRSLTARLSFALGVSFMERNSHSLFSVARSPSSLLRLTWVISIGAPTLPHARSISMIPLRTTGGSGAVWRVAAIVIKLRSSVSGRQKPMDKCKPLPEGGGNLQQHADQFEHDLHVFVSHGRWFFAE
jgi:hypothetical protein